MGYRIRYRDGILQHHRKKTDGKKRIALVICVLLFFGTRLLTGVTQKYFVHPPATVTEQAVWLLSQSLAAGEGWYYGLVVWCRQILGIGV